MAKLTKLRYHGAIPERQHDAFLLALLIAVSLNVAAFAIQAIIPRLAALLQALGPEQTSRMPEEESYPFVLVDSSLLDEEPDPVQLTEAEANVTRQARQIEARQELPDGFATIEEGIDEILTAPEGNPGSGVSFQQAPGDVGSDPGSDDQDVMSENRDTSESAPEETESQEMVEQTKAAEQTSIRQPLPDIPVEPFQSVPDIHEPVQPPVEEQASQNQPEFDTNKPIDDPPDTPTDNSEQVVENEPEPMAEMVDVAALPLSSDGFFDTETQRLEEALRRTEPVPSPSSGRRESPLQPQQTTQPQQPTEASQPQRIRPQSTFKRIGGATASGGAPRRRNTDSAVRLLDNDASMALLTHRYGPYMEKLARQLQASLNRVAVLSPMGYTRGQVKIRFGISPDGTLTYYDTVYPNDGSLEAERLLGEQMLREAAPFDPLTQEMRRDENFQRMTVVVHLY